MPRDFHGPGQDYVKFAVAQKATALLSQRQHQVSKQGVMQLCSQQCLITLRCWGFWFVCLFFLIIRVKYSISNSHQQAVCTSLLSVSFFPFQEKNRRLAVTTEYPCVLPFLNTKSKVTTEHFCYFYCISNPTAFTTADFFTLDQLEKFLCRADNGAFLPVCFLCSAFL